MSDYTKMRDVVYSTIAGLDGRGKLIETARGFYIQYNFKHDESKTVNSNMFGVRKYENALQNFVNVVNRTEKRLEEINSIWEQYCSLGNQVSSEDWKVE